MKYIFPLDTDSVYEAVSPFDFSKLWLPQLFSSVFNADAVLFNGTYNYAVYFAFTALWDYFTRTVTSILTCRRSSDLSASAKAARYFGFTIENNSGKFSNEPKWTTSSFRDRKTCMELCCLRIQFFKCMASKSPGSLFVQVISVRRRRRRHLKPNISKIPI